MTVRRWKELHRAIQDRLATAGPGAVFILHHEKRVDVYADYGLAMGPRELSQLQWFDVRHEDGGYTAEPCTPEQRVLFLKELEQATGAAERGGGDA